MTTFLNIGQFMEKMIQYKIVSHFGLKDFQMILMKIIF